MLVFTTGTWQWGNQLLYGYSEAMDAELQQVFNYAISRGISLFDTADSYVERPISLPPVSCCNRLHLGPTCRLHAQLHAAHGNCLGCRACVFLLHVPPLACNTCGTMCACRSYVRHVLIDPCIHHLRTNDACRHRAAERAQRAAPRQVHSGVSWAPGGKGWGAGRHKAGRLPLACNSWAVRGCMQVPLFLQPLIGALRFATGLCISRWQCQQGHAGYQKTLLFGACMTL